MTMPALGSYRTGCMLFSRFGTGWGSELIVEGVLEPMSFPYKTGVVSKSENHLFESRFYDEGVVTEAS